MGANEQYFRTLVRVEGRIGDDVEAVVMGWSSDETVWFPMSCVNDSVIEDDIYYMGRVPLRLFAKVNIGAEKASDLRFKDFEFAPDPDDYDLSYLAS